MCGPAAAVAIPIATTAIGLAQQANQSSNNAKTLDSNANVQDMKAADALTRGNANYTAQENKVKMFIGSQRAAQGASGLQVDSGSGGDVTAQTATTGELDAQTLRSNAQKEAWSYNVDANNMRFQARQSRGTARMIDPLGLNS